MKPVFCVNQTRNYRTLTKESNQEDKAISDVHLVSDIETGGVHLVEPRAVLVVDAQQDGRHPKWPHVCLLRVHLRTVRQPGVENITTVYEIIREVITVKIT